MMTQTQAERPKKSRIIIPGTQYHRVRKTVQTICFINFVTLPLFDIMRVDLAAPALLLLWRGTMDQRVLDRLPHPNVPVDLDRCDGDDIWPVSGAATSVRR